MRNEPWWAGMEEVAPTLAYDSEIMGDVSRGGTTQRIGRHGYHQRSSSAAGRARIG